MLATEALSKCRRIRLAVKPRRQVIWRDIAVSRPLAHCFAVDESGAVGRTPLVVMPLAPLARLIARHGFAWVPGSGGIWERNRGGEA